MRPGITRVIAALAVAAVVSTALHAGERAVSADNGVKINSAYSVAFPFVADKSGYLQRLRVNVDVTDSISPDVPVMLLVHNDRNGKVMDAFVEVTRTIRDGVSGREETVFEVPSGITLEQGQRYWLMCESPTGNEIRWWGTSQTGPRFRKNLQTGERTYETGTQAAFTTEVIASP